MGKLERHPGLTRQDKYCSGSLGTRSSSVRCVFSYSVRSAKMAFTVSKYMVLFAYLPCVPLPRYCLGAAVTTFLFFRGDFMGTHSLSNPIIPFEYVPEPPLSLRSFFILILSINILLITACTGEHVFPRDLRDHPAPASFLPFVMSIGSKAVVHKVRFSGGILSGSLYGYTCPVHPSAARFSSIPQKYSLCSKLSSWKCVVVGFMITICAFDGLPKLNSINIIIRARMVLFPDPLFNIIRRASSF